MDMVPICHLQTVDTSPVAPGSGLPGIDGTPSGWRVTEPVQGGRLRVLFGNFDTLRVAAETSRSESEARTIGVVAEDAFPTSQYAISRGPATVGFHATHLRDVTLGRVYADALLRSRPVEQHRLGRLSVSGFSAMLDTGDILLRVTFSDGRSLDQTPGAPPRTVEIEEGNRAFIQSL